MTESLATRRYVGAKGSTKKGRGYTADNMMDTKNDNHPLIKLGLQVYRTDIHASGIQQYQQCRRKYMYSELFHLRRKGEVSDALWMGTCFHRYMQELVQGRSNAEAKSIVSVDVAKSADALQGKADAMGFLPGGKSISNVLATMGEGNDKAYAMACWANDNHPWTEIEDYAGTTWTPVAQEETFRVKFKGMPAWCRATFDLVIVDEKRNELWIVDHKTTSWSPSTIVRTYAYSVQARLYRRMAELCFPDYKVMGVCHGVLLKPTIRQKQKQDFTDYLEEVAEWYSATGRWTKNQERWAKDPPFLRSWVRFTGDDKEMDYLLDEVQTASRARPDLYRFDRNEKTCFQFNRDCEYMPLCTSDENMWAQVIEEMYDVGHRDDKQDDYVEIGERDEVGTDSN